MIHLRLDKGQNGLLLPNCSLLQNCTVWDKLVLADTSYSHKFSG